MNAVIKDTTNTPHSEVFEKLWTLDHPELGTDPVSTEPLLSPEYFERERDLVFRRSWLNVGREGQIPNPGDYFVQEVAVCNTSVILVRGKDGTIRGFHNVCMHRQTKLVWDSKGTCGGFRCKYHGWSYSTDGRLVGIPDEDQFFDSFEKSENGLLPVTTDIWEGFIYINLEPNPKETLREFLGEMGERLSGYPFKELSTCYAYSGVFNANWKTGMYAFNEVYHLAFVHAASGGESLVPKENRYGRPLWVGLGSRHHTNTVGGSSNFKMTPVEAIAARHGPTVSQGAIGSLPGTNPSQHPNFALDINVIFPNHFVDTFQGTYFTYNFWPISVDKTYYEMRTYYAPPKNAAERFAQEFSRVWFRDILLEDLEMIEHSQQGLASGVRTEMHLQDSEVCVRHHLKVVDDHVAQRV